MHDYLGGEEREKEETGSTSKRNESGFHVRPVKERAI